MRDSLRIRHGRDLGGRRLGRRHLHFCAGVARRLHAPLALVLNPLRSLLDSTALSPGRTGGVDVVRSDTAHLLGLVGHVLRFHGARARGHGLSMTGKSLKRLMRRIKLHCGRLGPGGGMGCRVRVRARSARVFCSTSVVAVVLSGLVDGTTGCASRKSVALSLHSMRRGRVGCARVDIDSANRNVSTRTLPRVFSHCCRTGDGCRTSNSKVKLTLIGNLDRLRRKVLGMRDAISAKAAFALHLLARGACPGTVRTRRSVRGGPVSTRRAAVASAPARGRPVMLIMRSGTSVQRCVQDSFASVCRMVATGSNGRN